MSQIQVAWKAFSIAWETAEAWGILDPVHPHDQKGKPSQEKRPQNADEPIVKRRKGPDNQNKGPAELLVESVATCQLTSEVEPVSLTSVSVFSNPIPTATRAVLTGHDQL